MLRVELPLALPAIMAGVRLATVSTIGLVTVSAIIGQQSLGLLIRDGLERDFRTLIVVGAGLALLMAIIADLSVARVVACAHAVAARSMNMLGDVFDWLTDCRLVERLVGYRAPVGRARALHARRDDRGAGASRARSAAWLGHKRRFGTLGMNIANIGQTLPTFAILVLVVQAVGTGDAPVVGPLALFLVDDVVGDSSRSSPTCTRESQVSMTRIVTPRVDSG